MQGIQSAFCQTSFKGLLHRQDNAWCMVSCFLAVNMSNRFENGIHYFMDVRVQIFNPISDNRGFILYLTDFTNPIFRNLMQLKSQHLLPVQCLATRLLQPNLNFSSDLLSHPWYVILRDLTTKLMLLTVLSILLFQATPKLNSCGVIMLSDW